MYIHPRIKVTLFLLLASGIGGFAVATKLNQYFFEKSQAKKGGGNDQTVVEGEEEEGGRKKGKVSNDDDEDDEEHADQGDDGEEGEGPNKVNVAEKIDGASAVRYLIGKSVRLNPGVQPPRYSYHVARGLMGEGLPNKFSVRTWVRRQNMLCEGQPQGLLDCNKIIVIVGVPKDHEFTDVAYTEKEVKALAAKAVVVAKNASATKAKVEKELADKAEVARAAAEKAADASASTYDRLAAAQDSAGRLKSISQSAVRAAVANEAINIEKKAAQEALAQRIADSVLVNEDGTAKKKPAFGDQVATLIIGDKAYPILKGNMLGFPAFVPSVDKEKPEAAETKTAATPAKPAAPQVQPAPVVKTAFSAPREAKGFKDPEAKNLGFGAPKAMERQSFKSVNEGGDPGLTGKPAFDRILGKTMAPFGFKPSKLPPYLGYFQQDGHFMQITRDPTAPFEAIVYIMNWALKDERLCITGSPAPSDTAAAAPTPATPAPVAAPAPAATDNKSKPKGGKLGPTPVKAKSATGAGCLVPQISGHDETNISNIKGERLVIGTNAMLPNLAPLKIEPFGPFRPTGFSAVPVPAVKGAATPVSGPSATTAKGRI